MSMGVNISSSCLWCRCVRSEWPFQYAWSASTCHASRGDLQAAIPAENLAISALIVLWMRYHPSEVSG